MWDKFFTYFGKLLFIFIMLSIFGCGDSSTNSSGNNPFQGEWSFAISGGDSGTGTCTIPENGQFSFVIVLSLSGNVTGTVNNAGDVNAVIKYQGSQIGTLSGKLNGNSGNGVWQTSMAGTGIWTAVKK
jgi:hypothetical protein